MIDWYTVIAAATSSLGVSLGGAYWLARTLVQHRLLRALEDRKAELTQQLELQKALNAQDLERLKDFLQLEQVKAKSALDAEIRKSVETQLGELNAQRQYEYEAKRRLYLAIGPLRFQLLLASRDLVGRVQAMGVSEIYELQLDRYFARSTIYRILKPLALASLIEEQMALSDFSVDQDAIDLLRFRRSVTRIFSGDELTNNHPNVDWSQQVEHVFADSLAAVAQALIERSDSRNSRVIRFDEFDQKVSVQGWSTFSPIDKIFNQFKIQSKPLLWLRLVAYAQICNALVTRHGVALGFYQQEFNTAEILSRSHDGYIASHLSAFLQRIQEFEQMPL